MGYLDFAALKQHVPIDTVLPSLGLQMKFHGGQWRGPCPACKAGGKRALVVTPEKSAFYCFGGRTGGDVIALVAHIRGCAMKDAAAFLAGSEGQASGAGKPVVTVPEERRKEDARTLQPLTYLQTDHPALAGLGLQSETCLHFGAGYAPKGIMRGRLAIPLHDPGGRLVAYCGQSADGSEPGLVFPNGFDPQSVIFNSHRIVEAGETEDGSLLILARDPLEVMLAWQNGIANAVSFVTPSATAGQLERLSRWMSASNKSSIEFA
jgi:hypothetical protein